MREGSEGFAGEIANAAFIVRAANCHETLIDIVRELAMAYDGDADIYDVGERAKSYLKELKEKGIIP